MNYRHVTVHFTLKGLSPSKLISEMQKDGFEPLFSSFVRGSSKFLCCEDPFKKYKKITIRPTNAEKGIVFRVTSAVVKPFSFGELFKHEKFADLVFALFDQSDPKEKELWFCCWTDKEKSVDEPLDFFMTVVFKVIGCDKALDEIIDSVTFSKGHRQIVEELAEYDLKHASFVERKSTFETISDPKIRDILIEFSRKDNILLSDFLEERKSEDKDKLKRILNFLSGQRLLTKNLVVICDKTGQWWNMTIPSKAKLKELEKSGVTCASCGAKISEERIDDLFKISEKGKRLVSSSYWMVGKVVESLHKLGVREEDIFVDVTYNGEEIDIIALYMACVLVFELKDREFGLGDAYKFHGKISRLAEKAKTALQVVPTVITTKTVAKEARKLLSEVAGKSGIFYGTGVVRALEHQFIEGLAEVECEMRRLLDGQVRMVISRRLSNIHDKFPATSLREMDLL